MKMGVISDIHADINGAYPLLEALRAKLEREGADCLVIAGDISNHYTSTLRFVEELAQRVGKSVYFVPGNHDLWDQAGECRDTRSIYERYSRHPGCLVDKTVDLGAGWILTGETGWYDYSLGDPRYCARDFEERQKGGRVWQDSLHVHWHAPDRDVHRAMLHRLRERLADREKKYIAVTHMIPNALFSVSSGTEDWDYFNAFLGSREYGKAFMRAGVRYALFGHVHYRKQLKEDGVHYICPCLNYHTQWKSDALAHEIDEALVCVDLE